MGLSYLRRRNESLKNHLALILLISVLSSSCNKSGESTGAIIQTGDSVSIPFPETGLPPQALTFDTNVDLVNFTPEQTEKYNKALEIVKLVVATEEFRSQVLNHTYGGLKTFANNKGLSNAQIYQSILEAAEGLHPAKNNAIDLEVQLYYENNNVVGYTNPSTPRIWVNTKYFDTYLPNSVAANLFHEWLHKIGYAHDSSATVQRPYSVPYAVGYMVGNIGKNFL